MNIADANSLVELEKTSQTDCSTNPPRVCFIAYPSIPDNPGLTSFIKIFAPISKELIVITGGYHVTLPDLGTSISIKNVKNLRGGNKIRDRVINHVLFHLESALFLLANLARFDLGVFHVGTNLVLPMLVCKIARKKTLIVLSGIQSESTAYTFKNNRLKPFVIAANIVLEEINFHLATKMVAYSPHITKRLRLQRYRNKILASGARFVDTQAFTPRKSISDRGNIVGYVGRLSFEKAILNFIDAMPAIAKACPDVRFMIIGDGPLYTEVRSRIVNADLVNKVEVIQNISHTNMPRYFNEMKLLVLPSFTEGLPTILIEAMACGTPVLATRVGNIPDVIRDGKNGFFLDNNSPQCIAERTIEALNGLVTETISQKAVSTAREEFSYESAVMRYQKIIEAVYVAQNLTSLPDTRIRVLLIAYPSIPENPHLTELIKIFTPLTTRLYVVTGNYAVRQTSAQVFVKNAKSIVRARSLLSKGANHILFQLQSAHFLISNASSFDICVFHVGTTLSLPMLFSRLEAKRSLLYLSGSQAQLTRQTYGKTPWGHLLCRVIAAAEAVNIRLATMLVAYSATTIKDQKLERYRDKIVITAARFVDTGLFKLQTPIRDRQDFFGYAGRLSHEKGILNLIDAVPLIRQECPDARFCIIGDGPLCDEVKKRINEAGIQVGTTLTGMVPNRLIPGYLNQMKLLVLPSFTEGLPTILIEAMACGTPVLATRVGNIPDVIRDGKNGFLLDNNSPQCIAERTIEALNGLVTETISDNAMFTVASEYSYHLTVREHRKILRSLSLR